MQLEYSEFGMGRLAVFNPHRVEAQIQKGKTRAVAILRVAEELLSSGNDLVRDARASFQADELFDTMTKLRRLKGWIANFGGIRTCEIIEEIEQLVKERSEHPALPSMFDILALEFSRFLHAAERWVTEQRLLQDAPPSDPGVVVRLSHLVSQLQQARLDAVEYYDRLRPELGTALFQQTLDELDYAVHQLDYARALEILQPKLQQQR